MSTKYSNVQVSEMKPVENRKKMIEVDGEI